METGHPKTNAPLPHRFFNETATTEIYTLSLHDALPIWPIRPHRPDDCRLDRKLHRRQNRLPWISPSTALRLAHFDGRCPDFAGLLTMSDTRTGDRAVFFIVSKPAKSGHRQIGRANG